MTQETVNLSLPALLLAVSLLCIPIFLSLRFGLGLVRQIIFSFLRMSLQLALIGVFLVYIFKLNNPFINVVWLIVMVIVAVFSAIGRSYLSVKYVLWPAFASFFTATFFVVLFLNIFVVRLDFIFDARYLIVLGGMVLGNSLRGSIVGISSFYKGIKEHYKKYLFLIANGATVSEATLPFLKESMRLALQPTLAAMATMGIVSLPGMMTGVILGGADPVVAIKYQIMIMSAILVSTVFSVLMTIVFTRKSCFDSFGRLNQDIFAKK